MPNIRRSRPTRRSTQGLLVVGLVLATWLVAQPGMLRYLTAAVAGTCVGLWFLWQSVARNARHSRPLEQVASPEVVERVTAVQDQLDVHRRAQIVVDAAEANASAIPGRQPVIVVAPYWLLTPKLLAAVVAHEYGHINHRHWRTGLWIQPGIPLMWLSVAAATAAVRLLRGGVTGHLAALVATVAGLSCITTVALWARRQQRLNEFEADRVAATAVGAAEIAAALGEPDCADQPGPFSQYPSIAARLDALGHSATPHRNATQT